MTPFYKRQMSLIEDNPIFPSTRFQGSKLKVVDWIWDAIKDLDFYSTLDAFGGTGCVGYMLKQKGKKVTCNDVLKFNWYIGLSLIENDAEKLLKKEVDFLLTRHDGIKYPTFVYDTFKNIYFTDEENQWIDMVVTNIGLLDDIY
jgi:adenine-specific DNA methylase